MTDTTPSDRDTDAQIIWLASEITELRERLAYMTAARDAESERADRAVQVKPQLYLDCDGVLADFDAAFKANFGHEPRSYENAKGSDVFWRDIQHEAKEFYRNLPLMQDARQLYEAVRHLRPIILTGCPMGGWAEAQKLGWAAEHFPGVPMITCMSRNKRDYCQPGDILVDDLLRYRDRWEGAGGVFIHHTSAAGSIPAILAALVTP